MFYIKQDLPYVQGETYTSLDDQAQASLHSILRTTQPTVSRNKKNRWQITW